MHPIFDPSLVISDEGKVLIDFIGNPLKYKGKWVDKSVDKIEDRKAVK